MNSQHTPGPWKAKDVHGKCDNRKNSWTVEDEDAVCSIATPITLEDGTVVAFAVHSSERYSFDADDEQDANASLIAASPDLLALANAVIEKIEDDGEPAPGATWHAVYQQAQRVRAKALGGAS